MVLNSSVFLAELLESKSGIEFLEEFIVNQAVLGKLHEFQGSNSLEPQGYPQDKLKHAIPKHWGELTFGKHLDIQGGSQPPKNTFVDAMQEGYIRLYQIRDYGPNPIPVYVPRELVKKTSVKGDILIARYGASGKIFWAEDGAYNVALAKLVYPRDVLIPDFAYYLLKSSLFRNLVLSTTRVAVDGFNKNDLKNLYFPLPPIEEQRKIVATINEILTVVAQLKASEERSKKLSESMTRAALSEFATSESFEDLHVAWNRIQINWNIVAGSHENVEHLRSLILEMEMKRYLMRTSNVEPHDRKWTSAPLRDVCEYIQRGKGPKYASRGSYRVVSQKCVRWSGFDSEQSRFIEEESIIGYSAERFLQDGDLLWNSTGTGTVGRTALFKSDASGQKYVADSHVTVLRSRKIHPEYLYYWSRSPDIQDQVLNSTTGSTNQQELNLGKLKEMQITFPSMREQEFAVKRIKELFALCDQLEVATILMNGLSGRFVRSVVSKSA
jgi:type I restriction enzyme S subunit